jgi:cobalt/nickel transport system ATP-binding protein
MKTEVIKIRNLTYGYPDGKIALKDVNIDILEGETVGIVGPNGAGKTTLLLHLNGILQGNSCAGIDVLGMEINKRNIRAIRSKVGLVFQNPDDQLFSSTVFDDVAFGPLNLGLPPDEVRRRVQDALENVGMRGYEEKTPHHLSTGEKKKIAIATVLSLPCEILVLDEPTSNLDPKARRNLIHLLATLPQTKIIAGHDLDLVLKLCSRVIVLDGGAVAAAGAPREIFFDRKFMEFHHMELPVFPS